MPGNIRHKRFLIRRVKRSKFLVPPTYLIPRAIKQFLKSLTRSKTILICPYWPPAPFWSLLALSHDTYFPFVMSFISQKTQLCV